MEDRFGSPALLGEEELPGIDEPEDFDLEELKEAFLNSEWAERQPEHVEAPFEITIGEAVVRPRTTDSPIVISKGASTCSG